MPRLIVLRVDRGFARARHFSFGVGGAEIYRRDRNGPRPRRQGPFSAGFHFIDKASPMRIVFVLIVTPQQHTAVPHRR
jgi:hypothetical protein